MSSAAAVPLPLDRETRARLLRGFKRRRRLRRCPPIRYPHAAEREYLRAILAMLERAHEFVRAQLLPELPGIVELGGFRTDDDDRGVAGPIGRVFDWIELQYEQQVPVDQVRNAARRAGRDTSRHNREQVDRQVKTVLGLEVFPSEPWLDGAMDSFVRQNVQLIKTVPSRYFEEIEQIVHREVRAGHRAAEIAEQLEDRFDVARNRAALIAQDQVGKFNGQLTGQRHRDLGIRRYRWRNSRDERVRGNPGGLYPHAKYSHWTREGRIYEEDKPPPDGHPGEPIRCRCWREPVFEDILGPEFQIDLTPAPPADEYMPTNVGRRRTGRERENPRIEFGMTLRQAENAIRARRVEHLGVFGSDGALLHRAVGTSNQVPVSDRVIRLIRADGDAVITHNHPGGSPLSPQDLAVAAVSNAREIRAAVRGGGAWFARRTRLDWGVSALDWPALVNIMQTVYRDGMQRALSSFATFAARHPGASREESLRAWQRRYRREIVAAYRRFGEPRGWEVGKQR